MMFPRFFRYVPALLVASTAAGCNSEPSGTFELPVVSKSKVKRDARVNGKEDGRPQLALEHDFGTLLSGQVVTHPFTIHNESSETWTFAQFGSDCGCTVASASVRSIPPACLSLVTFAVAKTRSSRLCRRFWFVNTIDWRIRFRFRTRR